jgi:hypothetical protein
MLFLDRYALSNGVLGFPSKFLYAEMQIECMHSFREWFLSIFLYIILDLQQK